MATVCVPPDRLRETGGSLQDAGGSENYSRAMKQIITLHAPDINYMYTVLAVEPLHELDGVPVR